MSYLPFETTEVTPEVSTGKITALLNECGFEETALLNSKGRRVVVAKWGKAEFAFELDHKAILDKIIQNASNRRQREIRNKTAAGLLVLSQFHEKAERIGWRLMHEHVKAVCDSIKLGVITPAQAFAGHLIVRQRSGETITVGQQIAQAAHDGTLGGPDMIAGLLPFPPRGESDNDG